MISASKKSRNIFSSGDPWRFAISTLPETCPFSGSARRGAPACHPRSRSRRLSGRFVSRQPVSV
eukprot:5233736-Pyramimonas_sp.AAC.1